MGFWTRPKYSRLELMAIFAIYLCIQGFLKFWF